VRALVLLVPLLGACTLIFGHENTSPDDPSCKCDAPPASSCLDTSTMRVYSATGTCNSKSCDYVYTDSLCVEGCVGNACIGQDPCTGVACITPPAPSCSDPDTLQTYEISGMCFLGQCSYTSTGTSCPNGCAGASCVGSSSCVGVVCNTPPAPVCADADTLTVPVELGVCANGGCNYSSTPMSCPNGCANGACNTDPCQGVVCNEPPAATCIDADTRQTYGGGICAEGECTYAPTNSTCTYGCLNGACQANPCANITCTGPGNSTSVCDQGECEYSCNTGYEGCAEGYSCLASCSVTSPFSFPATGDSLENGDEGVIGSRTIPTLASATMFASTWQIEDLLASGCTLSYGIYLNNTLIGSAVAQGADMTPTLSLSFTFPAITGPSYLIEYRPTSTPAAGCGAVGIELDVSTVTLQ